MNSGNKDSEITLGIETLENKDLVLNKLGLFFLIATHVEKILAEYIFEKTKNDQFRDTTLGAKEKEFNRITSSFPLRRYSTTTSLLKNFRERRNDITHKTLIIDPHYFKSALSVNWRNEETSDEISAEGYLLFINESIKVGRDVLLELAAIFLYDDLPDKDFEESKILLTKMSFCFHNKHC